MSTQRILTYLFWFYLLALILATAIPLSVGDSSFTLNDNYTLNIRWDYLVHAMVYMPLPLFMSFLIPNKPKESVKTTRIKMKILFFSLTLAAAFEFLQLLLSYRTFNINDLAGNTGGVLLGYSLILVFNLNRNLSSSINLNRKLK